MSADLALPILAAAVPIVLGLITFEWQQQRTRRSDEARELRQKRLEYLTSSYEAIAAIAPAGGVGFLTIEEKRDVEKAFRDAYLYGNQRVVAAMQDILSWARSDRSNTGDFNKLLSAIRDALRTFTRSRAIRMTPLRGFELAGAMSNAFISWAQCDSWEQAQLPMQSVSAKQS